LEEKDDSVQGTHGWTNEGIKRNNKLRRLIATDREERGTHLIRKGMISLKSSCQAKGKEKELKQARRMIWRFWQCSYK